VEVTFTRSSNTNVFATKETISSFLAGVSEEFRRRGVLYLVGESSLVIEGKRSFVNEIIVAGEVDEHDQDDFRRAVDSAASVAGIAVAIEHPADVIPLPADAASRARRVTGFHRDDAPLQIRHFDPYTTSIRFIARGDEPDYDLVVSFLEMGWVEMSGLDDEIRKLLPRFSFDTIQQDPAEFRRKFKGLTQIWRARAGVGSDGLTAGGVKV